MVYFVKYIKKYYFEIYTTPLNTMPPLPQTCLQLILTLEALLQQFDNFDELLTKVRS